LYTSPDSKSFTNRFAKKLQRFYEIFATKCIIRWHTTLDFLALKGLNIFANHGFCKSENYPIYMLCIILLLYLYYRNNFTQQIIFSEKYTNCLQQAKREEKRGKRAIYLLLILLTFEESEKENKCIKGENYHQGKVDEIFYK